MINVNELRSRIYGKHRSITAFAASVSEDEQKIRRIANGKQLPTADVIMKISEDLGLDEHAVYAIFLLPLSHKSMTEA